MKDIDTGIVNQLIETSKEVEGSNLFEDLVGLFKDETPNRVSEMRKAIQVGDFETLHRAAHSLKSGSAYLGAKKISEISKVIEIASAESKVKDNINELLGDIEESYEVAMDYLNSKLVA